MLSITAKDITDEQGRLEVIRKNYEPVKQLCTELCYPERGLQWDVFGLNIEGKESTTRGRKIYDPTAVASREIWADGIMGNYMPKDINWFMGQMAEKKLRESKRVRQWLQGGDEHFRLVLSQSNYYEQKRVTINDSGVIGDSYLYIEPDEDSGKLMMLAPHPREFWVRRDFWGRVVGIHHKFEKTIRDVAKEFGTEALSTAQAEKLKTLPNTKVGIIRAIYKNEDYDPEGIGVKDMRWQICYVNTSYGSNNQNTTGKIIKYDGSHTLNPIPWALNRPSHEHYGYGIVISMLVEIITTNLMGKSTLEAVQQAADPSMIITSALKHKLNRRPGAMNFVNSREMQGIKMGDLISRLVDVSGYPFGKENHEVWQAMIRERFGVSLFLALNNAGNQGYKNIEHIRAAQAERAVLMAPFLGTLGTTTDAEMDRIWSIEYEAKRAPQPPQEVIDAQNDRVDIQYIGPLHQLLKYYYETGNLLNTIANIQQVLMVAKDSGIVFDGDELMRKVLESGNTPESIILSKDDVLELKTIAAQQMEEQRMMQQAAQASAAVPNLSKKIEQDSILSNLQKSLAA